MATASETIREYIKRSDLQQAEVARLVGMTPQTLSGRLGRNALSADDFLKLLEVLGYTALIVENASKE